MILVQRDNFLPPEALESIRAEVLKLNLYWKEEYNSKFNRNENWPGKRSDVLSNVNPELNTVLHNNLETLPWLKGLKFNIFAHWRSEGSAKSEIHCDNESLAGLIYLNPTNTKSGTYIYNATEIINDIKYVQNRLIVYSGAQPHQSYGHFGDSPENGRLTLNLFIDAVHDEPSDYSK
jgi:hypothetical protein